MSTVIDDGVELETAWSGATGWTDPAIGAGRGVLNTLPFVAGALVTAKQPKRGRLDQVHRDLSKERDEILRLLNEQATWRVGDLRRAVGLDAGAIGGLIDRLRRDGFVARKSHGVVTLRPCARQAA